MSKTNNNGIRPIYSFVRTSSYNY